MKSGNLNFVEPSRPLQACNGTDLPLPLPLGMYVCIYVRMFARLYVCTRMSRSYAISTEIGTASIYTFETAT